VAGEDVRTGYRVVGIDHVQLAMPAGAEEAATRFYEGILGLDRVPKPARLAPRGGCWFSNGQVQIHLGVEEGFRAARKAHPALRVQELDALAIGLDQQGHDVRWDDELPDVRRCFVDDPFGNRIELIEAP
jgi:catechol 2,3-dioxygenase-like lactoylglutathione lyase family enzyme